MPLVIIEQPPKLSLPGFRLRQLQRADIGAWFRCLTDPLVFEHTSWAVETPDDLLSLLNNYESPNPESPIRLAIVDTGGNEFVGTIGFHTISSHNRVAEIAYEIAPIYWGRGIATESCQTLTMWGFNNLGFNRIQASTLDSNHRSQRVLQKCSFEFEGILRAYRMVRGNPGDFKMYAKLRSD